MKKKYLIILFLLSIIFIPKNTFALSNSDTYVASNGQTYNVDISNNESILDYAFFTYVYPNSNYENSSFVLYGTQTITHAFTFTFDTLSFQNGSNGNVSWKVNTGDTITKVNLDDLTTETNTRYTIYINATLYSNTTFTNTNTNTTFTANTSVSDILSRYPQLEEPEPEPSDDMTKKEVYDGLQETMYVGLVLLATLIMIIFFKWCFPMKGGKKI